MEKEELEQRVMYLENLVKHIMKSNKLLIELNSSKRSNAKSVNQFLDLNCIQYEEEKRLSDFIIQNNEVDQMRFDFYLNDFNIVIEYDGIQHFEPISHFGGEDAFYKQKRIDQIKDEFCKENGLKLIRIEYDTPEDEMSYQIINAILNDQYKQIQHISSEQTLVDKYLKDFLESINLNEVIYVNELLKYFKTYLKYYEKGRIQINLKDFTDACDEILSQKGYELMNNTVKYNNEITKYFRLFV